MKEIKIVPYTSSHVTQDTSKLLFDIMIKAYAVTEIEIWGSDYLRMPFDEFQQLVDNDKIIAAKVDGTFVGSVHVYPLDENTFSFGLLSVDPAFEGRGIGRRLIAAAESRAMDAGARWMEIEVLRLRDKDLSFKKVLDQWYRRLGYEWTVTQNFIDRKPDKIEKAKNFVQPSVFDCYRKSLVSN